MQNRIVLFLFMFVNGACTGNFYNNSAEITLLEFLTYAQENTVLLQGERDWQWSVAPLKEQKVEVNSETTHKDLNSTNNTPLEVVSEGRITTSEKFQVNPNIHLTAEFQGQLVHITLNAIRRLPVSISMETAHGNEQHIANCTFDENGMEEIYSCEKSRLKRDWEHGSYENKGSGSYYFKRKHSIGDVEIENAQKIAEFTKKLAFAIFQSAGDKECDYLIGYSIKTPNFKKNIEAIFAQSDFENRAGEIQSIWSEDQGVEFVFQFSGYFHNSTLNRDGLMVYINGVPTNRFHQTQLEFLRFIEQELKLSYQASCFPVKWHYVLPIGIGKKDELWKIN